MTGEAATLLAAKLKTPLQIGQHLVRAFEAGFEIETKPIDAGVIGAVLSRQMPVLMSSSIPIRTGCACWARTDGHSAAAARPPVSNALRRIERPPLCV